MEKMAEVVPASGKGEEERVVPASGKREEEGVVSTVMGEEEREALVATYARIPQLGLAELPHPKFIGYTPGVLPNFGLLANLITGEKVLYPDEEGSLRIAFDKRSKLQAGFIAGGVLGEVWANSSKGLNLSAWAEQNYPHTQHILQHYPALPPAEAWLGPEEWLSRQKTYQPMTLTLPQQDIGKIPSMRAYYLKSPIQGAQLFWEVRGILNTLISESKMALRGGTYIHRRERNWLKSMELYEVPLHKSVKRQ